jgi:hypothetical protein
MNGTRLRPVPHSATTRCAIAERRVQVPAAHNHSVASQSGHARITFAVTASSGVGCAVMNDARVLRLLRAACKEAGSQNNWAKQHRVSQQYLNHVLNGHRRPGPRILEALGLERSVATTYTRKAAADAE